MMRCCTAFASLKNTQKETESTEQLPAQTYEGGLPLG